jgi:outer membrane protein insertion porin family
VIKIFKAFFFAFLTIYTSSSFSQIILGENDLKIDYASPQEFTLGGVTIEGTSFLDKTMLLNTTGLIVGDKITVPGSRITRAIQNLWDMNLFADVKLYATKIQNGQVFFLIEVEERPRLSKFAFFGIRRSEADDIREKIKLIRGKIVTENLIVNTENRIKNHYIDKGFLDCEVQIKQKNDTSTTNGVTLDVIIKKNKKVRIKEIEFIGVNNIKLSKLKRSMKDTKQFRWWNVFKQSKYIDENFEKDKFSIIEKYNNRGFRDARIIGDTIVRIDKRYVKLQIKVDEGHKFYFRNITWVGNTIHSSRKLSIRLGINKGEVFNQNLLDSRLQMSQDGRDISTLYMDSGYLFFQINPVEVLVENDSIDFEMRIYEGKQATINRVIVKGNTKTNDRVILREIRTKPGQLFNRSDIIRTQRELAQLKFFDEQKLGVNPKPNPQDGTVDIEYTVEEKPSDQVQLQAGWGNRSLIGTLALTFNNFSTKNFLKKGAWKPLPSGDGQTLALSAQSSGFSYQYYSANFVEPWLGGKKPNMFSASFTHLKRSNNFTYVKSTDPAASYFTITGLTLGLGKRLKKPDDFFQLYQEVTLQQYFLRNFQNVFDFSYGKANELSYKLVLSRSSNDAAIYPTSGSNITGTFVFTPPYSLFRSNSENSQNYYQDITNGGTRNTRWVEYYKWKFSSQWYTELFPKFVLAAKFGIGSLGRYNNNMGYSPFQRFMLGGSGMGFFNFGGNEIIALRGYSDGQKISSVKGDIAISKYNIELRYPISLNPSATIFVLGFTEGGYTWATRNDFNPFNVAKSAGIGAKIFLPMFGLVSLDYGWPIDPSMQRQGDPGKGNFHFTLGANIGDL